MIFCNLLANSFLPSHSLNSALWPPLRQPIMNAAKRSPEVWQIPAGQLRKLPWMPWFSPLKKRWGKCQRIVVVKCSSSLSLIFPHAVVGCFWQHKNPMAWHHRFPPSANYHSFRACPGGRSPAMLFLPSVTSPGRVKEVVWLLPSYISYVSSRPWLSVFHHPSMDSWSFSSHQWDRNVHPQEGLEENGVSGPLDRLGATSSSLSCLRSIDLCQPR